jgi:hypothetical protein
MLLDSRVGEVELERQWLGQARQLRCYAGKGDLTGTGMSVALSTSPALPLPPAQLTAERNADTGTINLHWQPRHRLDSNGSGSFAPPPDHLPQAYRITIGEASTVRRVADSSAPSWPYELADQMTDWGEPAKLFNFSVCQLSPVLGEGHKSEGAFGG